MSERCLLGTGDSGDWSRYPHRSLECKNRFGGFHVNERCSPYLCTRMEWLPFGASECCVPAARWYHCQVRTESGARRPSRPPAARDKRKVPPDLRRQPTREGQRTAVESLCSDITQSQARARHFCVRPCARDISEHGDRWRRVARCR